MFFALTLAACGGDDGSPKDQDTGNVDGDDAGDDGDGSGDTPDKPKIDAGTIKKDAAVAVTPKDGGTTGDGGVKDAGPVTSLDSGTPPKADASTPPIKDSGTTPPVTTPDTGGPTGSKSGPCKDLNLFCFDAVDMFIFNPSDCFTCNSGKGCQGCGLPYAY